jgi:hypothetical protein
MRDLPCLSLVEAQSLSASGLGEWDHDETKSHRSHFAAHVSALDTWPHYPGSTYLDHAHWSITGFLWRLFYGDRTYALRGDHVRPDQGHYPASGYPKCVRHIFCNVPC